MKTEPESYSIDDLREQGTTSWDGIRNYTSRNYMWHEMAIDDPVLFYHSSAKPPGVIGLARVSSEPYPDHTAWDESSHYFDAKSTPDKPRWWMVDVAYVDTFPRLVSLDELRDVPELAGMPLVSKSRLSVQPVSPEQFALICDLARRVE
ncbi:MAG: EVE domain-containing protein [Acidimicrobiia bacterium]|nr:EVE domain-containing protein [Acidimicrobiia bacterium]